MRGILGIVVAVTIGVAGCSNLAPPCPARSGPEFQQPPQTIEFSSNYLALKLLVELIKDNPDCPELTRGQLTAADRAATVAIGDYYEIVELYDPGSEVYIRYFQIALQEINHLADLVAANEQLAR